MTRKTKIIACVIVAALLAALLFAGCESDKYTYREIAAGEENFNNAVINHSETDAQIPPFGLDLIFVPSYLELALVNINKNELVRIDIWGSPLENIELLKEWVENYRLGIPDKVVVLIDGHRNDQRLLILKSDGSEIYAVTQYRQSLDRTEPGSLPQTFKSSFVIKGTYSFIFGDDIQDNSWRGLYVLRYADYKVDDSERLEWNPQTDAPLAGITPEQAEQFVMALFERMHHGDEPVWSKITTSYAMTFGGNTFFIVYESHYFESPSRQFDNVFAISTDGGLAFIQEGDVWVLWYDANEKVITPLCN